MTNKVKAMFFNGSPRKNGNTAQLLKRAMDGASEAGAEVELVNLYDRSLNYKAARKVFAHSRMTFSPYSRRPWRPTCFFAVLLSMCIIRLLAFVHSWSD